MSLHIREMYFGASGVTSAYLGDCDQTLHNLILASRNTRNDG